MINFGYTRIAAVSPKVAIADIEANKTEIIRLINEFSTKGVEILTFPEMCITGYTCGDLFKQSLLLEKSISALNEIAQTTKNLDITIAVGLPLSRNNKLYNCAAICSSGKLIGIVPKSYLPNYNEFYEKRWFESGNNIRNTTIFVGDNEVPFGTDLLFKKGEVIIGVEICEDLWVPIPPSSEMALGGANVILNLSASDEVIGKHQYLVNLITHQSAACRATYVYASSGIGESSTDLVFTGNAIIAENGSILSESPRFTGSEVSVIADTDIDILNKERQNYATFGEKVSNSFRIININNTGTTHRNSELLRNVNPMPFVPAEDTKLNERCQEIISIQAAGLMQRLRFTGCKKIVVGISGGLDSTLALLVAVKAFDNLKLDRKGIFGITMPGFGTTHRTHNNATDMMALLGVTSLEIPIGESVNLHFKDINHDSSIHDITYENCQARERTQILMDYSNKIGGMVIGTGDLSELALGWCTYNGDHMSMYAVNASIPKTLVKHLVNWFASTTTSIQLRDALIDIINTPISPELLPADENGDIAQKTEDLVGPYELHDFFLYNTIRHCFTPAKVYMLAKHAFANTYTDKTILHWLKTFYRRFFNQQFKRSCMPDGPKVGSICLSPRGDWRMPSDASARLWLSELDNL